MAEPEQIDGNGPAAVVPPMSMNEDDGSPPAVRIPTLRDASPDPEPQKKGPAPFSLPQVSFFGTPALVAPKENPSMTQSFQAKNLPTLQGSTTKADPGEKNIFVIGVCVHLSVPLATGVVRPSASSPSMQPVSISFSCDGYPRCFLRCSVSFAFLCVQTPGAPNGCHAGTLRW